MTSRDNRCVKKSDVTYDSVRARIKDMRSIDSVIQYMHSLHWNFGLSTYAEDSGRMWIGFQKVRDWNELAILTSRLKFGFAENISDTSNLLVTLKKSAELCLRVQEVFNDCMPANPDYYGRITIDNIASNPNYLTNYIEFNEKHKALELTRVSVLEDEKSPFFFSYYNQNLWLSKESAKKLLESYQRVYSLQIEGVLPIVCNNRVPSS